MKTPILLTILFASTVSQAAPAAQILPIKNSFAVTEIVLRGSQPLGKAQALKEAGVRQVLIFKNDTKGEVEKEKAELKAAGFTARNIHHIPMAWKDVDLQTACNQTVEALQILAKAEATNKPIFFHCTVGEDRTGMLAGLYRMLVTGASLDEAFESEMCERGYSDGNRAKPGHVVSAIEEGLTPLFMAMATEIEKSQMDISELSGEICENLKLVKSVPRCRS